MENTNHIDFSRLMFIKLPSKKLGPDSNFLLNAIKKVEKRTFPTNEALDFNAELSKRTTNLYCAFMYIGGNLELCGYVVYIRCKIVTRIHKVCVVEEKRGQGIGKWMLSLVMRDLRKGGARTVDLWVDKSRDIARKLYMSCGFKEREAIENYYSPGSDAIRMDIDLGDW